MSENEKAPVKEGQSGKKDHFKMFFVCPNCGKSLISAADLEDEVISGTQYCTRCGEKITNALVEALADLNLLKGVGT